MSAEFSGWEESRESVDYPAVRVMFTNRTAAPCRVGHYTLNWTEKDTRAVHASEQWPVNLLIEPHGSLPRTVSLRELGVDRSARASIEVRQVSCDL